METVTEAKKKALLAYKSIPCSSSCGALGAVRIKADQTTCHCTNHYWLILCSKIQNVADPVNTKGIYNGVKKTTGLSATKTTLLKAKTGEVITDQSKQLECWVEHYLKMYVT